MRKGFSSLGKSPKIRKETLRRRNTQFIPLRVVRTSDVVTQCPWRTFSQVEVPEVTKVDILPEVSSSSSGKRLCAMYFRGRPFVYRFVTIIKVLEDKTPLCPRFSR